MSRKIVQGYRTFAPAGGSISLGAVLVAGALAAGTTFAQPPAPFVDSGTLDPEIPTPESVIGHAVGATAVRYDPLVKYLHALAEASDLVTLTPYARSHEGRTLYHLTITSPANHARLQAIKADNAKLADPRTLRNAAEADRIVETLPGVAWMAYAIHGDELSSTDAAMQVAYQLTAGTDAATRTLREQLVIHIDPLMNPDGRERYLAQLQTLQGKVENPDYQAMQHGGLWSAGRGNHYLFDLNRDWLMQVHPETRGRAEVILSWNPHLVVDSHEMGGLDTYLFDPPREPINIHLALRTLEWRRRFSADQAAAFDRHGWSYYTREWYEEWYPGYTNAWAGMIGAIGILYEQAAVNAASIKQATGLTLTYREAVHHHVVSSMANLTSLVNNRRAVLSDYLADRRWAVSGEGPSTGTFLLPPAADRAKQARFVELLGRQGLELTIAEAVIEATGVIDMWGNRRETATFEPGTLVIESAQPQRRLLHAILGFDPHMTDAFLTEERTELESRRSSRIYDTTAWNLPMAYGLEGYWAEGVDGVRGAPPQPEPDRPDVDLGPPPAYGYLIDGRDSDVYRALVVLLESDCKPRVADKPFSIADHAYERGTVLLRRHENPESLPRILRGIAGDLNVDVRPVDTALSEKGPDLGGQRFHLLHPPRVAIASQWPVATTSFGSTWYLFDQRIGLRVSPVNVQRLGAIDLRKYNVLVLPHVWSPGLLGGVLDESTVKRIKRWVEAGGTLVALGGAAAFVADEQRDLSGVRLKRNVLDELTVYEEAVERERAARKITVDPATVWSRPGSASPEAEADDKADDEADATGEKPKPPASDSDSKALKRADEWHRLFAPQGAFVTATLDPEHWLSFGLPERVPVLIGGGFAYMSRYPVRTPVRLADEDHLRLSGLLWPEARERLADTAYATVESVGRGQIVLIASDPFFRGYLEGSGRLLLNAVILGPGMGTSQPVPW